MTGVNKILKAHGKMNEKKFCILKKKHFWIPAYDTVNTWISLLENLITEILPEILKDLETDHIYAHSDEQIITCLCHIICKEPVLYQDVKLLLGGY